MRWVNNFKTAMLLAALTALCMAVGYFAGGTNGVLMGFFFGGFMNVIAYFFSDKIALASMRAQEVPREELPWLHDMVERLAARAGIPKPRVYVSPQSAPNAFATGRNPQNAVVAVTAGMLRFPQHELEGVLAHEIGHVKHRDILIATIAAVMASAISMLGWMLMWGGHGRDRENPLGAIGALAMVILAPLAAGLLQAAISRQREFAADSYGGELAGDPNRLASALERLAAVNERVPMEAGNPALHSLFIVQPLSGGGMLSLFSTHPPIEQRVAALREQAARLRAGL
ncbi:MAG: zinc metalloprotease HtpX [Planctomycetota bacterium]